MKLDNIFVKEYNAGGLGFTDTRISELAPHFESLVNSEGQELLVISEELVKGLFAITRHDKGFNVMRAILQEGKVK